ncbi:MAG: ABC transporter permease, partial [Stackebrandtia sp.]
MKGLGKVIRSGVGRRRVPTIVIGLVVMLAVTSAVIGGTLMTAADEPFNRAFAQQRGAHLTASFDAGKVTTEQLRNSANADGVAASSGPFATVSINPRDAGDNPMPALTIAGRSRPSGDVDEVKLLEGRWAKRPGEIVLYAENSRSLGPQSIVGETLRLPDLPGNPTLTVVGTARSVSETAGGWVVPEQIEELTPPKSEAGYQMLYRFDAAATKAQLDAGRDAVVDSAPGAALTGSQSWLTIRKSRIMNTTLLVPFLLAFGMLGVLMAVLIIGNVVAGAVSTGTRRIGVLKALGFTPGQVVRAYVAQALIPAVIGAAAGVVIGRLLTTPLLAQTNELFGTSDYGGAWWIAAAVP